MRNARTVVRIEDRSIDMAARRFRPPGYAFFRNRPMGGFFAVTCVD